MGFWSRRRGQQHAAEPAELPDAGDEQRTEFLAGRGRGEEEEESRGRRAGGGQFEEAENLMRPSFHFFGGGFFFTRESIEMALVDHLSRPV